MKYMKSTSRSENHATMHDHDEQKLQVCLSLIIVPISLGGGGGGDVILISGDKLCGT